MKTGLTCCFIMVLVFGGDWPAAWADNGPLASTNRLPLHLMFLKPRPVTVQPPQKGALTTTLALEYSNTYFDESNSRWNVLMDMEMTVVDLSLSWGVTSRLALRLDLPLVSMNNGFLDEFLGDFHDLIGVENYGREDRPDNTFAYGVTKDGLDWVTGDNGGWHWADATVSFQYALKASKGPGKLSSALLFSLKVPIGNENRGRGSGALDYGLYLPVQWSAKRWTLYGMPSIAFIGDPQNDGVSIEARNSFGLFGGAAYDYSDRLRLLAQLNYYSSPIEKTGISELDDGTLGLDVGFQYALKEGRIVEFAFCEDLTQAAPDFNIRLALKWGYTGW